MNSLEFRAAVDQFRHAIASGPLEATLQATTLALSESRAALCCAGKGDETLIGELLAVQIKLQQVLEPTRVPGP